MFPVQLMSVRRSKKGTLRSVFLTEENSDYCSSIIDLFSRSVGRSRGDIEEDIKTMELKVQNPRILRGLALIMFRRSEFRKPSPLDSELVRRTIFSMARNPIVNPVDRKQLLEKIASSMSSSLQEVDDAIYGDKESNLILFSPFKASPDELSKKYNEEQIETVIMKSLWVEVSTKSHSNDFIRSIRSKGLLYEERVEGSTRILRVNGPVSIFEKSERYGMKLALFVKYVLSHDDWELNAAISLKNNQGKKTKDEFLYHLDESISDLIGREESAEEQIPSFVDRRPKSIQVDGSVITPDYSVRIEDGDEVSIFISTPIYYDDEIINVRKIISSGTKAELFCLLEGKEKCPKGAVCFKDEVDWWRIREYITEKYSGKRQKQETGVKEEVTSNGKNALSVKLTPQMVSHLNSLYPDSQAMVEYLEFMGIPPEAGLSEAGFRTAWKGLRLVVIGRKG